MRFKLPSFEFYQRMSARERTLSLMVGGALLLIVNLVAISTLLRSSRDLRAQIADRSQELHVQNMYAQEEPMWKQRMNWLKGKQPGLANRDRAYPDLLGEIEAAARVNRITLTNPQPNQSMPLGERAAKPAYQAVSMSVETQSDWYSLVQFLALLQRPEGFLVFDKATLRTEPNDPQRMHGTFTISKWYASGAK